MPSFGISICILSALQGSLVALPGAHEIRVLARLRSGAWALLPLAALAGFVVGSDALAGLANGLSWLALLTVPPLAAVALGWAARGARPWLAVVAALLFALAWGTRGSLAGEAAGAVLEALSCVTLSVLLVAVAPPLLVRLGIVATSIVDVCLIASQRLQAQNEKLVRAAPPAHLPQLQAVLFGRASLGYEDLFVAALLGALLAAQPRVARHAALLVGSLALSFDTLFLAFDTLPATVPVAAAVVALEARSLTGRRGSRTMAQTNRPGGAATMAYLKPAPFLKIFNPLAILTGIGGSTALVVARRRTGGTQRIPVVPVDHDGARHVISARGESEWVRNVRAAGRLELGGTRYAASEVPVAERAPIIAAYRKKAGRAVAGYWKALPDPGDHPTFRLDASS